MAPCSHQGEHMGLEPSDRSRIDTPNNLLEHSVDSCLHNSELCRMRNPFSQKEHVLTRKHSKNLTEVQAIAAP